MEDLPSHLQHLEHVASWFATEGKERDVLGWVPQKQTLRQRFARKKFIRRCSQEQHLWGSEWSRIGYKQLHQRPWPLTPSTLEWHWPFRPCPKREKESKLPLGREYYMIKAGTFGHKAIPIWGWVAQFWSGEGPASKYIVMPTTAFNCLGLGEHWPQLVTWPQPNCKEVWVMQASAWNIWWAPPVSTIPNLTGIWGLVTFNNLVYQLSLQISQQNHCISSFWRNFLLVFYLLFHIFYLLTSPDCILDTVCGSAFSWLIFSPATSSLLFIFPMTFLFQLFFWFLKSYIRFLSNLFLVHIFKLFL